MDVLMLKPVFKDAIWGGKLLSDFGYKEAGDSAGECWGISAHKNGDCTVMNGEFAGKTLSWCWENHRELFGNMEGDVFPLLIKILGAEAYRFIQTMNMQQNMKTVLLERQSVGTFLTVKRMLLLLLVIMLRIKKNWQI